MAPSVAKLVMLVLVAVELGAGADVLRSVSPAISLESAVPLCYTILYNFCHASF